MPWAAACLFGAISGPGCTIIDTKVVVGAVAAPAGSSVAGQRPQPVDKAARATEGGPVVGSSNRVVAESSPASGVESGLANETRPGSGWMQVQLGGETYSGRWVRTSRNRNEPVTSASTFKRPWDPVEVVSEQERAASTGNFMALLLSPQGRRLSCSLVRSGNAPITGECFDDAGRTYEVRFEYGNPRKVMQ